MRNVDLQSIAAIWPQFDIEKAAVAIFILDSHVDEHQMKEIVVQKTLADKRNNNK